MTVPVGTPKPAGIRTTVAVNVTGCPNFDGFAEDAKEVFVFALSTVWFSVPVLVLNAPVGEYTAVITCGDPATDNVEIELLLAIDVLPVPGARETGVPKSTPSTLN
jgi:hypothetical protein